MHIERFKRWSKDIPPKKLVHWLDRHHMGPYVFSGLSIVAKCIAIWLFATGHEIAGGIVVLIDYLFDGMDGRMARVLNRTTVYGAFTDLLSDRVFRTLYLPAMAVGGILSWELAMAAVVLDLCYATFSDFMAAHRTMKAPKWGLDSWRVIAFGAPVGLMSIAIWVKLLVGTPLFLTQLVYTAIVNRRLARPKKG